MRNTHPAILIGLGLLAGLLIGVVATLTLQDDGERERDEFDAWQEQHRASGASDPHGGGPLGGDPHGGDPHGGAGAPFAGHGAPKSAASSFAKVHFMKKFVAALTDMPANMAPNPSYRPLLAEGAQPIACADCHDSGSISMEAMLENDPGREAVEPQRRDPRFMVPLMEAWVERLNRMHGDRLRKPVTCTDCHAIDPRDGETRVRVYPALMKSFVDALREPPENKHPASAWKPLLKDPATPTMYCARCHGEPGRVLESKLPQLDLSRPELADNHAFMVNLMERWVSRLNREMRGDLVKAVACIDCHETDPRR